MKKTIILLTVASLIAAFMHIPFIMAGSNEVIPTWLWILFPLGSALAILLFGWLGFISIDKSILEMPVLTKWVKNEKTVLNLMVKLLSCPNPKVQN